MFIYFAHFLIVISFIYIYIYIELLIYFGNNPLSVVSFAIIFSHYERCLFNLFVVSCEKTFKLESHSMFLGWKNQFCENYHTTKCNLQIQWDPYQITKTFFTELEQKDLEKGWKHKRLQIAKEIFRKKNGAGGINLPGFRLCYKATVIKTVWYWHKDRNID